MSYPQGYDNYNDYIDDYFSNEDEDTLEELGGTIKHQDSYPEYSDYPHYTENYSENYPEDYPEDYPGNYNEDYPENNHKI